ncbi:hypothetical protein BN873_p20009 [Candidatus Competibacter denitrificans Run_A_D11]|uniref:Uncharacterized protein n=1 Tax=Candidatus Competibacter denitrificans Run_A_D11 TaxID=1400863 RepID=W6MC35_9GAMM|nr:hypothetical protein BN873_p20009 [Candidatus Competibacter denitrificans Run_A_D11]
MFSDTQFKIGTYLKWRRVARLLVLPRVRSYAGSLLNARIWALTYLSVIVSLIVNPTSPRSSFLDNQ